MLSATLSAWNRTGIGDLLRRTFAQAAKHPNKWREGKEITESAGKFATWFETVTGALASEVVERAADIGIGLVEHDYLVNELGEDKQAVKRERPEK